MGCSASTAAMIAQEPGSAKDTAAKTSGADGREMPQGHPSSKEVDSKEQRDAEAAALPLQANSTAAEPAESKTGTAEHAGEHTGQGALKAGDVQQSKEVAQAPPPQAESALGINEQGSAAPHSPSNINSNTRNAVEEQVAPPKASAGTAESTLKGGAAEKGSEGGGTAGHNSKEDKERDSEAGGEHSDSDSSEGTGSAQEGVGQSEEGEEKSESSEGSDEDEGGSEGDGGQEESSGGSDGDDDDDDEDDDDEDDDDEDDDEQEEEEEGGGRSEDSSAEEDNFVEEGPDKDDDSDEDSFAARRRKARGKRQGPVWLSAPGKLAAPDPSSKDRSTVECGVRMSWLRSWAEYVVQKLEGKKNKDVRERLTSGEVCDKVVIPETREHKCRYADLLEPGLVGPPDYFISHTWGGKFQDLIDVLSQRLEDNPDAFVWLDLCAINQQKYADKSELQSDDISGLSDVVGKVQSTLFCLDEYGTTLSRVWCLFEVWHTIKAKGPAGLQILTYKLDDSSLEAAFMMLDVSKAKASIESDRVRILREMEHDMGLAELTLSIKESFLLSTKLEVEQALAKLEQQQSCSDEKGARKLMKGAMAACEKAAQIAKLSASHDAAQAHAVKGCELFLELLSQGDTSAMSSRVGLKNCLDWDRCPSECEAIERRILDKQREVLGPKSIHTCCTLSCLVTTLGQMEGRLADAEALQEQLVAAVGPKNSLVKAGASTLEAVKGINNPAAQETKLRERAKEQCQKHGPGHPKALEAMRSLATNLLSQSKNAEAKEVQQRIVEQESKVLEQQKKKKGGAKSIESQAKTQTMVIQLVMLGNTEGAVHMYQQMLDEVGPGSDMCRATGLALAQSLKGSAMHASVLGKHEEAEGKYTQAVQALQVPLEHLHAKRGWSVDKLELMSALAGAKSGMGRFAEAEQIQREVIGMQPKPTGIQHIGIASSMSELADTLTKQEKHEEAEHWLRQAANVYRKFMGPGPLTEMVNASLAACLRKQGKDAEARALQP